MGAGTALAPRAGHRLGPQSASTAGRPRLLDMHAREDEPTDPTPQKGDRIELLRTRAGVRPRGTVFYSDDLQILVKWDNGQSTSLRPGTDRFKIVQPDS